MNYLSYLKLTSKTIFASLIIIAIGCNEGEIDRFTTINVTINFINDTNDSITIRGGCFFDELDFGDDITSTLKVNSGDTLTVHQTDRREYTSKEELTIDDFYIIPGPCGAMYGDSLKCEGSFNTAFLKNENYEKREEISKNNFEFTYRFTGATKEAAGKCQ